MSILKILRSPIWRYVAISYLYKRSYLCSPKTITPRYMIDCVQFMFSLRRFYRSVNVAWGNMRNRISLALLFIGCVTGASAQLNSSVLSQGSWYFLETSSDDAYVLDGDLLYGDMQLSTPIPFATLG
ncbi:MAG: hypothetical protein DBW80_00745, partial [Bacteroidetes bacterium]